jgi:hypothetical protein
MAHLITVAEYEQIPGRNEGFYYELHHGELVKVCFPKAKHFRLQRRLRQLLEAPAGTAGIVDIEIAFRPMPGILGGQREAPSNQGHYARWFD